MKYHRKFGVVQFGHAVAAVYDRRLSIQQIAAVRDRRYSKLNHYRKFVVSWFAA